MPERSQTARKDGSVWRIGTEDEVAWINAGWVGGRSITASIPPVFDAYATLAFPLGLEVSREVLRPREDRFDDTLLRVLSAHTEPQPWWLGFLETGGSDVVLNEAPRIIRPCSKKPSSMIEATTLLLALARKHSSRISY